jgi:hypothetical protein
MAVMRPTETKTVVMAARYRVDLLGELNSEEVFEPLVTSVRGQSVEEIRDETVW